jgi:hypothetical protein
MSRNNPENPEITLKTLKLPLRNPGITLIENTTKKKKKKKKTMRILN